MSARKILSEIKQDLEPYVGTYIKVKANRGRKKVVERTGVLESTYPNLFVVRINEKSVERRVSFSYADILTETVVLTVSKDGKDMNFTTEKA
ncbi:MAG: Veg protein [Peptococcaceae bacterium BICA1-8]|nr:MAG: Veg protein [Clostridiaceae bacterium BRH_c20a]KJS82347.1 MAG: Veg protein [Peptococcaceae bacterium BICA1-8]